LKSLLLFCLFIFINIVAVFVTFLFLKFVFPKIDQFLGHFSFWVFKKIKKNHQMMLLISEVLFIICSLFTFIFLAITYFKGHYFIGTLSISFYSIFIIFISSFIFNLRDYIGVKKNNSLLLAFANKVNKENYFISRLSILFGKTAQSLSIYIFSIIILFSGGSVFTDLPYQTYYFILISIPIGLAGWVYLSSFDKPSQNLRRILAYLLLVFISLGKSYFDFMVLIELNSSNPFFDYMFFILLTVFIAIDRLVKSVLDDIYDFKKEKVII
jgi:hypothetical protein